MTTRRSITAHWLGRIGYDEAHRLQERLVAARVAGEIGDTLLLLEHDAVITLGRSAKSEHIVVSEQDREAKGVALYETGRGGDVTFHGPGQLVAYPILDLKPDRCDVRRYVADLCAVMSALAAEHGVASSMLPNLIGVWVDENAPSSLDVDRAKDAAIGVPTDLQLAKLGAIGVRLSRWVTMHGFAFNITTDLSASGFGLIVACGIRELGVTSLERLGVKTLPTVEEAARASLPHFARVFDADVTLTSAPP
ncbi:MAG: lipoyl(octanoyl) transferase LipB [Labilithrix sp.]|nr:lipoyl(octanoyl) transferase LipB [Labilithrix sp.]MCW5817083.1 lipoyl(octanoyl) transferase LipB [Labilithrix sp.]